jgi:hypothetical protein
MKFAMSARNLSLVPAPSGDTNALPILITAVCQLKAVITKIVDKLWAYNKEIPRFLKGAYNYIVLIESFFMLFSSNQPKTPINLHLLYNPALKVAVLLKLKCFLVLLLRLF